MSSDANFPERRGMLLTPFVEWGLANPDHSGNPYDITASVTFDHVESGEEITTGMFYGGEDIWKFRFTGTRIGKWRFTTASDVPGLDGKGGTVVIEPDPDAKVTGFITNIGNRWAWGARDEVFVPQLVMYDDPSAYHNNPEKIDRDIQTFMVEHGFNGFHVPVLCRWLDIDQERYEGIDSADPNPDPRTFEALELLIMKVNSAGGMVHIWLWGDNDGNHHMTPMKKGWGGKNGRVDKRLQRYLAARLGPIPGWTMGYGFDLEHWVDEEDLKEWHTTMRKLLGWPHILGGRSGTPKNGKELKLIYDGLDYAGYTHLRPTYADYVKSLETNPDKPVFSEDRFRIRSPKFGYASKDYDKEMTRRGLWHSMMAGGVANIWGRLEEDKKGGGSVPYPNKDQIKTCARFFEGRFTNDLIRDNSVTDGLCLRDQDRTVYIVYKEDTSSIMLDLSDAGGAMQAIAVDAKKAYEEIDLGALNPGKQNMALPYRSDWAVYAVGDEE